MNHNPRVTLDSNSLEASTALAEGNPGAASVLGQLLQDDSGLGFIDLCHLDDMEMYGAMIWIGYKNICKEDIEEFKKKLRNRTIVEEVKATPDYLYMKNARSF